MNKKQKILLRTATLVDVLFIVDIYLRSRKKFISFAPLNHSKTSVIKWMSEVIIPTDQVIIAEKNNIILGMMVLSKQEKMGWIEQLYIAPEAVGQGIGTLLVAEAKSILGYPIRLHTFQENSGARKFYEKHGFRAIEFSDGSMNEENCPDILYEWRV